MADRSSAALAERFRATCRELPWYGVLVALAILLGGCSEREREPGSALPPRVAPEVSVVASAVFPHDPAAFTEGLFFHDGFLYESTGQRGASGLRKVDLATGEIVQRADLADRYFGEGIALLDGRVYQLSWQEHTGFVFDLDTFEQVGDFTFTGEGWGMTTDGSALIRSDGSDILYFFDPDTFEVVRTLEVKDGDYAVQYLNELEWIDGEIWANIWNQDAIVRIDPATGQVIQWLDVAGIAPSVRYQDPDAVANGIAYDAATGRIFLTGKLWPELYEVEVPPVPE